MDLISFQMFIIFLKGIQFTVGQLTITTTPAVIESEITRSLVVTCSFPPTPSSGYQVFSLAIKKFTSNFTLEQIASINRDTHTTVRIDAPSYGISRSSGIIDSTQGSSLTLEWLDPKISESGTYQCKANMINQADDFFVINANTTVSFTQPLVSSLIQRLKELEVDMNNKLQRMETDFYNLAAQSTQTNNKLQKLETELLGLESTLFKKSSIFNGRHYYLSLYQPHSAANAEMACRALGGYLAEVDSKSEFDFLGSLVGTPIAFYIEFLLGGTDEGHEGRWINRHSGTPLGYATWGPDQPDNFFYNNARENCQCLDFSPSSNVFEINDCTCFNTVGAHAYYFICEVPV